MFPLNGDQESVAYEAPFGVVEIGRSEVEKALAYHREAGVRPREIQNWIYAGDAQGGVTIGSSVVAWDYAEVCGGQGGQYPILQPILPLIAVVPETKDDRADLAESRSFLSLSAGNMVVTAVKKSEDGHEVIVRFYETEGKSSSRVRISAEGTLSGARRTNLIEEDCGRLEHDREGTTLEVGAFSIETVKLTP